MGHLQHIYAILGPKIGLIPILDPFEVGRLAEKEQIPVVNRVKIAKMAILAGVVGGLRGCSGVLRAAIWDTTYLRDIRPKNRLGTDFRPL